MCVIDHVAEVSEMQGAVVYLASQISDFMVGQELVLDGGYTVM
jgi:NAD(P)-dependent dehydrogenase (short-subunit alcohol dehydrogenase family)